MYIELLNDDMHVLIPEHALAMVTRQDGLLVIRTMTGTVVQVEADRDWVADLYRQIINGFERPGYLVKTQDVHVLIIDESPAPEAAATGE